MLRQMGVSTKERFRMLKKERKMSNNEIRKQNRGVIKWFEDLKTKSLQ